MKRSEALTILSNLVHLYFKEECIEHAELTLSSLEAAGLFPQHATDDVYINDKGEKITIKLTSLGWDNETE